MRKHMKNENDCLYCLATHQRLKLAAALESGRYYEQPHHQKTNDYQLDPRDNYSITGVATAELTDALWVNRHDTWSTYPRETFRETFPELRPNRGNKLRIQSKETADQIAQRLGPGDVMNCPEDTACIMGLHLPNSNTHPNTIMVNASLLTPEERDKAGIPTDQQAPHPLNMLDFRDAARFIRRFHQFLEGHCTAVPALRKLVRSTLRGPYYRYNDAETHVTVVEIHQDLATPMWRVSTPAGSSEPMAGIAAAASWANRILRQQGYQEISTPYP